jgi:hypothetical protein
MTEATDPWGDAWDNFFQTRAVPIQEEQAFRQYLADQQVPADASIQDLDAHYDQFRRTWEPEP